MGSKTWEARILTFIHSLVQLFLGQPVQKPSIGHGGIRTVLKSSDAMLQGRQGGKNHGARSGCGNAQLWLRIRYCPGNNPAGAGLQGDMKQQAPCSPCWDFWNHTICLIERLFQKLNVFNIKELNQ